jgi:hypothetical protein
MKTCLHLIVVLAFFGVFYASCGTRGMTSGTATPTMPPTIQPLATAFSSVRFSTFPEVEAYVGFDIPEPHGYLPTTISARTGPQGYGVSVRAIYRDSSGGYTYLDIISPEIWPDGPEVRLRREILGQWDGWIIADDHLHTEFAFRCADAEAGPVWCVVNGAGTAASTLSDFVTSMG